MKGPEETMMHYKRNKNRFKTIRGAELVQEASCRRMLVRGSQILRPPKCSRWPQEGLDGSLLLSCVALTGDNGSKTHVKT